MYYSLNKRTISHVKQVHTNCFPYTLIVVVSSLMYIKRNNIVWEKKLTLHVHVGRLVHEMHEELGGVDEDLVTAVSDGAVPPRTLWQRRRKLKGMESKGRAILKDECVTAQSTVSNREEDLPQQQGGWPWRLVRTPGAPTEESKIKGKLEQQKASYSQMSECLSRILWSWVTDATGMLSNQWMSSKHQF